MVAFVDLHFGARGWNAPREAVAQQVYREETTCGSWRVSRRRHGKAVIVAQGSEVGERDSLGWRQERLSHPSALSRRKFGEILAAASLGSLSGLVLPDPLSASEEQDKPSLPPKVTSRVFFDITVNDKPIGRLTFGLFGTEAPETVANFLSMIPKTTPPRGRGPPAAASSPSGGIGEPAISYENSTVFRCVPGELLDLGRIRNLSSVTINDQVYYEVQGKLVDARAQLEVNSVPVSRRGLLTKQKFGIGPEFAITLAENFPSADRYVVFGQLEAGSEVLQEIERLPVRTYRSTEKEGSVPDKIFNAQKRFMTAFGQNVLRDRRALDAYPYKILRRVEASRCGLLL